MARTEAVRPGAACNGAALWRINASADPYRWQTRSAVVFTAPCLKQLRFSPSHSLGVVREPDKLLAETFLSVGEQLVTNRVVVINWLQTFSEIRLVLVNFILWEQLFCHTVVFWLCFFHTHPRTQHISQSCAPKPLLPAILWSSYRFRGSFLF